MATILVLQPSTVGPGRLGATLRDHAFKLDIRKIDAQPDGAVDPIPPHLDGYQGLLCLGGPAAPDADLPWIEAELELIRQANDRQLPLVGICLGHQLIARALGGEVAPMTKPEWGFETVTLNHAGQTDSLLGGIPWDCPQFESHTYEVTSPPPGATILAGSEGCKNQIMRLGQRTFSFQYHFEVDAAMLDHFVRTDAEIMERAEINNSIFRAQALEHYEMFARAADRLCVNLATYAFPFSSLTAV